MQNLNFMLQGTTASGLTEVWLVTSVHTGITLGKISWYSRWRRYTFEDFGNNIYDASCLTEIAKFLEEQMFIKSQNRT